MITLDFETEAIEGNPLVVPPRPVGLAMYWPSGIKQYITGWDAMQLHWEAALTTDHDLLFHNAPFDLSVGCQHFNTSWPPWERVHDTMYLLFLADPYAFSLGLKPSAERYLDEPPDEQNALHDWILSNVPGATKKNAGAYISLAPEELVRPYAIGDVVRTKGLYDYFQGSLR
tara:strand:- start:440 stop:955 length:516 start_codon:yes stop_codon:yes gene_type:complete